MTAAAFVVALMVSAWGAVMLDGGTRDRAASQVFAGVLTLAVGVLSLVAVLLTIVWTSSW